MCVVCVYHDIVHVWFNWYCVNIFRVCICTNPPFQVSFEVCLCRVLEVSVVVVFHFGHGRQLWVWITLCAVVCVVY